MSILLRKTEQLLHESPETLEEISINAGVNFHWLMKFRRGVIKNPGVLTVERLHDYLAAAKSKAA